MSGTKIFVIIVLLLGSTQVLPSKTRYVKAGNATPVAPYLTQSTAADSIMKAMAVADSGDTLLLLPGTYSEVVVMKDYTSLIGVDTSLVNFRYPTTRSRFIYYINMGNGCQVKGITINILNWTWDVSRIFGGRDSDQTFMPKDVLVEDIKVNGLFAGTGGVFHLRDGIIRNCNLKGDLITFYYDFSGQQEDTLIVENVTDYSTEFGIEFLETSFSRVIFRNCVFQSPTDFSPVLNYDSYNLNVEFTNCMFQWSPGGGSYTRGYSDIKYNVKYLNCTFAGRKGILFRYFNGNFSVRNCIFNRSWDVLQRFATGNIDFKYNFFTDCKIPDYLDSTNINGCNTPSEGSYEEISPELRLDKYSDAIDKGDPKIRDVDGSRSDPGVLGGPGGRSYVYPDLPPPSVDSLFLFRNNATGNYEISWPQYCVGDVKKFYVYVGKNGYLISCNDQYFIGATTEKKILCPISRITSLDRLTIAIDAEDSLGQMNLNNCQRRIPIIITGVDNNDHQPLTTGIKAVFPNPTTGLIEVDYTLQTNATVSLTVFNITGETEAEVLCNEPKEWGGHKQQVQLRGASGIYLVRLTVLNDKGEKQEFTQKVSLVK